MAHYLLVAALLLLQINLSLHQPLAHSTQAPSPQLHSHSHSGDFHALESVPELNDLHEHLSDHNSADHNSADHSHQTLYLPGLFSAFPRSVISPVYGYDRSHRSPPVISWLRPPRSFSSA